MSCHCCTTQCNYAFFTHQKGAPHVDTISFHLSVYLCPQCSPIIDKTIHRFFKKYGRSLQTTVQQPRPYFPPAPSELPAVQQHSVAQCLRAPQTCTISATAIVLMLNSDMILKCYPQAAVTLTARQGRMKHGRSFLAIVAIRRSVAASRAATGRREAMRSMREIGCSPSPGSGGDNISCTLTVWMRTKTSTVYKNTVRTAL